MCLALRGFLLFLHLHLVLLLPRPHPLLTASNSSCFSISPLQVRAAAVHPVLHPGSDDDRGLRADLPGALQRHAVRDGPERRERW